MTVQDSPDPQTITNLLLAHGDGAPDAFDRLVPLVYEDLRRVARAQLRRLRAGDTLDTAGLVHEAYLRLVDRARVTWRDRGHFLAVSALAMRQILIDHARTRGRMKRGGDARQVTLDDDLAVTQHASELIELDQALERLGAIDPRLVSVVECRHFAGYSEEETATALGVSLRTAQRDWLKAKAWLRQELVK